MRGQARPIGLLTLAAALFVLALGASPAKAAFGIAEWQALTCKENKDTPTEAGSLPPKALVGFFPLPKDPEQCTKAETPESEARWYTQAAGHPNFGITDFTLNTLPVPAGFPDGFVKEIIVDTPEGLGVNPEATPEKCTLAQLAEEPKEPIPACPVKSLVGYNYLTVAAESPLTGCDKEPPVGLDKCLNLRAKIPVWNVEVPSDVEDDLYGTPSMVGFPTSNVGEPTLIVGDLDPVDQHVRFTISDIHAPDATHPPIIGSRLVFNGKAAPAETETYLTMPSNCAGGQTSILTVRSHTGAEDQESFTTAVGASGCELVPFNPDLETTASGATDSPEPATVDVQMPEQLKAKEPIANSHLKKATITLPQGAGLNPSVANGLTPCTDAQFKKGTDDPIECPESAKIGTVEVDTAALDEPLGGDVYVAEPKSSNPSSGEQFRIFIHAFNVRYAVNVRLIGNVFPNLQTGQLTVVVAENPQAPFNSFRVKLNGGPRGALTSPGTCGPHTTTAVYEPWSAPELGNATRTSDFTLTTAPGGGACAATLAQRPFAPGFKAGTQSSKAGAYSPFELHIARPDGQQELKRVDVQLPPGMVAKLAGVAYCPEASIVAAAATAGKSEVASPSCPANSLVGTFGTRVGSGAAPLSIGGKVYFAGPYKGAPVSMVFVTPAVAGPYDLGTVVIRAALNIDPETAVVRAVSDPIPDVFGGVKLDVRAIDIAINRKGYTLNPTNCSPFAVSSEISGGGGNPAEPALWSTSKPSSPFQATGCNALKFKPKFTARILGSKTKRTANPRFQAILQARSGHANLKRAAFILPRATILDQSHIKTVCTRVQLAAGNCPKGSVYGNAKARTPLLDGALKGPVYLVSSDNKLPDLLVNLRGQVNVRLRGVISSQGGRLKTVFRSAPDVPVKKFTLNMKGGKQGLLINSKNLCGQKRFGVLNLKAQNGKRLKTKKLRLHVKSCNKKK